MIFGPYTQTFISSLANTLCSFVKSKVENGILLSKLFWPTVRKNCSSDREKLLKFEAEGWEFAKIFEITRTIYSNSERSEQVLVTELVPGGFSGTIN